MRIFNERLVLKNPPHFFDYSGVSNVHTHLSSGLGTFKEVILSAQDSNLDFIFFTDLNSSQSRKFSSMKELKALEGYYGKLFVFMDGEFSYLDSKLLNYDSMNAYEFSSAGEAQRVFSDYLSRRLKDKEHGIFILAHPFKKGYQWSGEYPIGLDGIEIINLSSIWQTVWKEKRYTYFKAILLYPFNFQLALIHLLHIPLKEIRLWDQLSRKRKTIGFSGTDAKGKSHFIFLYIKIPSYRKLFKMVRNHILLDSELTGHARMDRQKISNAIRKGHFFMSFDFLENAKGFTAYIEKGKKIYKMGSSIEWEGNRPLLRVLLPQKPIVPLKIVVYKDGEVFFTERAHQFKRELTSPGVYRMVVLVQPRLPFWRKTKWVPWIFTNPFYINSVEKLEKINNGDS